MSSLSRFDPLQNLGSTIEGIQHRLDVLADPLARWVFEDDMSKRPALDNALDQPPGNASVEDQVVNAADTYLVGSAIVFPALKESYAGQQIRWRFTATKTAAGTATPIWVVRVGLAGSVADAAVLTFTGPAQTAAADTAFIEIEVTIRTTGATAVITGVLRMDHNLAATGFANQGAVVLQATSAAFDATPEDLIFGVSVNPGAAGVWTHTAVSADLVLDSFSARRVQEANLNWRFTGINAAPEDVLYAHGGGIVIRHQGSALDEAILKPRFTSAGDASALGLARFNFDVSPYMMAIIDLAAVANIRFLMGFKNVLVDTFDESSAIDHVHVAFDTGSAVSPTKWRLSARNFNVAVADIAAPTEIAPVAAATRYILEVFIDEGRRAHAWVNGLLIGTTRAMTGSQSLSARPIPIIGTKVLTAAVVQMSIRRIVVSRNHAVAGS